jgi:hypothetical protein
MRLVASGEESLQPSNTSRVSGVSAGGVTVKSQLVPSIKEIVAGAV